MSADVARDNHGRFDVCRWREGVYPVVYDAGPGYLWGTLRNGNNQVANVYFKDEASLRRLRDRRTSPRGSASPCDDGSGPKGDFGNGPSAIAAACCSLRHTIGDPVG